MAPKVLKSVQKPIAPAPEPPRQRLAPAVLRDIAERADPTHPPAVVSAGRVSQLVNFRVDIALADWLADQAEAEGTTQKVVITRALAAAGAPVSPRDLEDRRPRRQRARRV
jgi:hypothetical protein